MKPMKKARSPEKSHGFSVFRLRRRLNPWTVKISPGRVGQVYSYARRNAPKHPFHNIGHIASVLGAAIRIAELEGIKKNSRAFQVLEASVLLHDIIYEKGKTDNEARSVEVAKRILPAAGFNKREVNLACRLIMATNPGTNPKSKLEKIISDADLHNLGTKDFWHENRLVAIENGKNPNSREHLEGTLAFIGGFEFRTESGRKLYQAQWESNRQKLIKMLN